MATGTIKKPSLPEVIIEQKASASTSISANGSAWISSFSVAKAGYTVIGLAGVYIQGTSVVAVPYAYYLDNSGMFSCACRNLTSANGSYIAKPSVVYMKNP